jgi:hypothetical protein
MTEKMVCWEMKEAAGRRARNIYLRMTPSIFNVKIDQKQETVDARLATCSLLCGRVFAEKLIVPLALVFKRRAALSNIGRGHLSSIALHPQPISLPHE